MSDVIERPVVMTLDHRFKRASGEERVISEHEEILHIKKFDTTPATIRRSFGTTINTGNYESVKVEVSVEVPCYVEDIYLADEWASEFIQSRVKEAYRSVRSKKPKPQGPI